MYAKLVNSSSYTYKGDVYNWKLSCFGGNPRHLQCFVQVPNYFQPWHFCLKHSWQGVGAQFLNHFENHWHASQTHGFLAVSFHTMKSINGKQKHGELDMPGYSLTIKCLAGLYSSIMMDLTRKTDISRTDFIFIEMSRVWSWNVFFMFTVEKHSGVNWMIGCSTLTKVIWTHQHMWQLQHINILLTNLLVWKHNSSHKINYIPVRHEQHYAYWYHNFCDAGVL